MRLMLSCRPFFACFVLIFSCFGLVPTVMADPLPAEAYAKLPLQQMTLSPDGTKLAVVMSGGGGHRLSVFPVHRGAKPVSLDMGLFEPRFFFWKTDQTLIVGLRHINTNETNYYPRPETRLVAFSADLTDAKDLIHTSTAKYIPPIQDNVISILPNDPEHILVMIGTLRLVDINGGMVERTQLGTYGWPMADPQGIVRLGSITDRSKQEYLTRANLDERFHPIFRGEVNTGELFNPIAFSKTDPKVLYVESDRETGRVAIWEVDADTGAFVRVLAADDHDGVRGIVRFPTNELVGYEVGQDDDRVSYIAPGWQADYLALKKALPGRGIQIIDRTANGAQVLLVSKNGVEPYEYWVLDRSSGKPQLVNIAADYEGIDDAHVAPAKRVTFVARDGLKIPAIVTLPIGYQTGPIPFIVLPHGGPTERDTYDFDYLSQFLASRGYGVLQPEFRGSTGFSTAFERAGYAEWGLKMQDDITDGTHWLIDQKLADPKRICIFGWSYGGYASLMGAIKEPSLYQCSAAVAPVTNLRRLVEEYRFYLFSDINLPRLGNDNDVLNDTSPIKNVEKIQIPVLLIHGRKDFTVPVRESEHMEDALKSAKKSVKAIYFDEEDHYFLHEKDRADLLRAVEAFLVTNLGPGFQGGGSSATTATAH